MKSNIKKHNTFVEYLQSEWDIIVSPYFIGIYKWHEILLLLNAVVFVLSGLSLMFLDVVTKFGLEPQFNFPIFFYIILFIFMEIIYFIGQRYFHKDKIISYFEIFNNKLLALLSSILLCLNLYNLYNISKILASLKSTTLFSVIILPIIIFIWLWLNKQIKPKTK